MKNIKPFLILFLAFLVTACKVDLYTSLEEAEANEMMALLLKHRIDCEKLPGKEDRWVLRVSEKQLTAAVERLKAEGYPKQQFQSIGDIFKKEGLVSSPLTERVRFVYALSQELSHTISRIDGVLDARVHVVLPENDPLAPVLMPASASVFVRHRAGSPIKDSIPQIKQLVVNSIEGLTYDKVSVALFPSNVEPTPTPETQVVNASLTTLAVPIVLTILCLGLLLYRIRQKRNAATPEVSHA